ncbi:MAG: YceI family protein [Wenzhouxiangellaceae bacterium]|nr:MAG: YceI family protein [Wenzhouxiangellaceae bacterium]
MNWIHRITMAATLLAATTAALAEPREFEIDEEHFSIMFRVSHVGFADQIGLFLDAQGSFVYDEEANELHSGEVVVDASSVFTNHRRRDNHVRNSDFLHARRHGEIRFEADGWYPSEDDPRSGRLTGQLTLLGETRPVELAATINKMDYFPFGHEKYTMGVSASTTIVRSEWGMTYGVEDGLVGDEVHLAFEFEALAQ